MLIAVSFPQFFQEENHIVGSCTNNAYVDQPKSKIVYMLLVDAGFSASAYRQSKAKHHTAGDNESVPSDIQPFNSEKIFYCISVQILVFSLFSVYPQHTVTDADMRLNVLRTVLLRLQLFAQCRHKHSQGSYIVFPAAAPDLLRDIGVCQHLSDIMREQTQKLVFNRGQVQFLPV